MRPRALRSSLANRGHSLPAARTPGQMQDADEAYRADLNNVLSEAHLDLEYVLGGGGRPSSLRLAHVIREQTPGDTSPQ